MEFSLDGDTLPSQARSVRGESRRLRRERDNVMTFFAFCLHRQCRLSAPLVRLA
jgi:hypothetical protein